MNPMRKLLPLLKLLAVGAFVSVLVALLVDWLVGAAIGPLAVAVTASIGGLLAATLIGVQSGAGGTRFGYKVAQEIDHIMIGAAETSFFVDSVKNKIEHDVRTLNEIVGKCRAERQYHRADRGECRAGRQRGA